MSILGIRPSVYPIHVFILFLVTMFIFKAQCLPEAVKNIDVKRRKELKAARHYGWSEDYGFMVSRETSQIRRKNALEAWKAGGEESSDILERWEFYDWRHHTS